MYYKCGYCDFVMGTNIRDVIRHFPLHSCLAAFEHVSIDENTGAPYGYQVPQAQDTGISEAFYVEGTGTSEASACVEDTGSTNVQDKWTHEEILCLINAYDQHRHQFNSPQYNKKQVWAKICAKLQEHNVFKSPLKCDEKWRNLKKQYEKIIKANSQTGSNRKTWIYFEKLHDVLLKNPNINPSFTLSSTGYATSQVDEASTASIDKDENMLPQESNIENLFETRNKCRKRKGSNVTGTENKQTKHSLSERREQAKERRHKEKMEQRERLFDWLKERDNEIQKNNTGCYKF